MPAVLALRCFRYPLLLLLVEFSRPNVAFVIKVIRPRAPTTAIVAPEAGVAVAISSAEFSAGRQQTARVILALACESETGSGMGDDFREVRVLLCMEWKQLCNLHMLKSFTVYYCLWACAACLNFKTRFI